MSSIEKLAVRGIRSFSPFDEEKIEFYKPLTLILGQNGAGKTVKLPLTVYKLLTDHNRKLADHDIRINAATYPGREDLHPRPTDLKLA